MPPKPRFTREEIGSSARPIFTVFRSMEELQQEVRSAAMRRFESYAGRTMPGVPLFKQVGMQMVLFGAQEPKLYQLLFMHENRSAVSFDDVFGALCATRVCRFSEEQLGRMLSTEFQAMMLLVKSGGQL